MTMQQVDDLGATYLAAENERVRTHTAALVLLDATALPGGALTVAQLRELVLERLDLVPAFRRRLAGVPLGLDRPYWIESDVELDYHVREVALPAPGNDEQLREQVARIFSRPLDRGRPLWEMYLIQGLAGGRSAVLTKIHHAIADARAGVQILTALTDATPWPRRRAASPPRPAPPPPASLTMLLRGLRGAVRQPVRAVSGLPAALTGMDELPVFGTMPGVRLLGATTAFVRRKRRHTAIARAPRTSFNRRISRQRRIGFATVALDDVRLVKNHFAVSVNDVVMAMSAGALRRWLLEHAELPAQSLTAVVPVALRGASSTDLGNDLSAVVVPIPTDVDDPAARLAVAHRAMLAALHDLGTTAPDALVDTIRMVPPAFAMRTVQLLSRLNTWAPRTPAMNVNISNVRGPQEPLYLAGAEVKSIVPLAGITDGLGLNLTVLSYRDRLAVGVVADRDQMPDVQRIADWMGDELAALVKFVAH
ncbi:wax ester/triacylglycerol synthase family O-acyltransferase [Kribbella speibonae]|uniref:Diacylglycerol O-acyltransferase n=1 Tax=Kribbella speibonae TaxID=1572660 RepID=A0A4R0IE66_9ACTN|nr:wax ester/triacylglycerol synthase family O-acyltransferase [Kribbella speibonae]TCC30777.1 wax ester/triacylglycerol synthase family O-acyltransferase [Kribbella speibonae]